MTAGEQRPGSTGGQQHSGPDEEYSRERLATMSRDELDALGASYDGVEVLHVDPGPAPGSRLEQRAIRQVGLLFFLAGLLSFAFVVVYVGSGWFLPEWSWTEHESTWSALFTPLLGATLGLSLDEDAGAWKAAVKGLDLPWPQGRLGPDSPAGVSSVPAYWLLSPDGKIVARASDPQELVGAIEAGLK